MTTPRQPFSAISFLKAGAAAAAIALAGQASAKDYTGQLAPYAGAGAKEYQNNWLPLPDSRLNMKLQGRDILPRLEKKAFVMTLESSPEDLSLNRDCDKTKNRGRYSQCSVPTTPTQALFEMGNQLYYIGVKCDKPKGISQNAPGTNAPDTYMSVKCTPTGDYSIKESDGGAIIPRVIGGQPADRPLFPFFR